MQRREATGVSRPAGCATGRRAGTDAFFTSGPVEGAQAGLEAEIEREGSRKTKNA